METGKWIVLAFLTGVIIIGFKTRSLKAWEFLASGAFVLLLDQLVFGGQIADWLGSLGSKAKDTADNGAAGMAVLLSPTARARACRCAALMWAHRPGWDDLAVAAAASLAAVVLLGWPWPVALATVTLALIGFTAVEAATDPHTTADRPARQDRRPKGGDT